MLVDARTLHVNNATFCEGFDFLGVVLLCVDHVRILNKAHRSSRVNGAPNCVMRTCSENGLWCAGGALASDAATKRVPKFDRHEIVRKYS